MTVLVTGSAGFIGVHTVAGLLAAGETVVGFDNRSGDAIGLGHARADRNAGHARYTDIQGDLAYPRALEKVLRRHRPEQVIHLAARPGVRDSLQRPHACNASNITGFLHVLEACRDSGVRHLVLASSGSVYAGDGTRPSREDDASDAPASLYTASKKADELLAYTYAHVHRLPVTALRLFTVYGPWGRPDMAYYEFARRILASEPIELFNHGDMQRDFIAIDDVVRAMVQISAAPPIDNAVPFAVYNLGSGEATPLGHFVDLLEHHLGHPAQRRLVAMPAGDVPATWADMQRTHDRFGFRAHTDLATGLGRFVDWYRDFHADECDL